MALQSKIQTEWDGKSGKLVFQCPFHLNDIVRSMTARFDPKTKTWKAPVTVLNIGVIDRNLDIFDLNDDAKAAISRINEMAVRPALVPFPREFANELIYPPMDFQWQILDKGWGLPAYAQFVDMGLGKTFMTILMAVARFKSKQISRVGIIAPSTLHMTWVKEIQKFAPADTFDIQLQKSGDKRQAEWFRTPDTKCKILLVSVEGLGVSTKLYEHCLEFFKDEKVFTIVDESSRIKNPKAVRAGRVVEIGALSYYRMILNGTPIALGMQDLFMQYEFLDPNIIGAGDYYAFKSRYLVMGGFEFRNVVDYQNVQELMEKVTPWTIEVRKKDVLKDLPDKIYSDIVIEPSAEQKRLFKQILSGGIDKDGLNPNVKVQNALEKVLRIQQVTSGFYPQINMDDGTTNLVPLSENPKFDTLIEFIEDHKDGNKFIIWAKFIQEIDDIASKLASIYGDRSVRRYYGGTSQEERSAIEDAYCNNPAMRFFVGNPATAGLGLTLISGENDVEIYYTGTFAFIDRAQSEDRAYRIGQKNSVQIIDFIMPGSIDRVIKAAIEYKTNVSDFVRDWIAKFGSLENLISGQASPDMLYSDDSATQEQ